jgi:hypothetical protein
MDDMPWWGWALLALGAVGVLGAGANVRELRRYLKIRKM